MARFLPFAISAAYPAALFAAMAGACGGGSTRAPAVPDDFVTPPPVIVDVDDDLRGNAVILSRRGDQLPDGTEIANIEDAAFALDDSATFIATLASTQEDRVVILRAPNGELRVLFDKTNAAADVDLASISLLRMAPTGESVFRTGETLDAARLHFETAGNLITLSGADGAASGAAARILGDFRIGMGGVVGFVTGGGDCIAEPSGDDIRYECDLALFVFDGETVAKVEQADLALGRGRTSSVRLALNDAGDVYFSAPSRRLNPILLQWSDGETTPIVFEGDEIPGLGIIRRISVVAANARRELAVVAAAPPAQQGVPSPNILGVLDATGEFREIARDGMELDGEEIRSIRGIEIADDGSVLFEARSSAPGPINTYAAGLYIGHEGGHLEVVREGGLLPGTDATVLRITGSRFNASGDTLFVVELGSPNDETLQISDVIAVVRRADGAYIPIAGPNDSLQIGTVSDLTIVGFLDDGRSLLIAERQSSSDRALLRGSAER